MQTNVDWLEIQDSCQIIALIEWGMPGIPRTYQISMQASSGIFIGPSLLIFFSFSSSIRIHIFWSIATHELLIKLINIVLHTNDIKQTNNKCNNQQTFCLLHSTPKNHVRWRIRSTDPPVDVPHEKHLLTMYKGNTYPPALGPNSLIISFSLTARVDFQW